MTLPFPAGYRGETRIHELRGAPSNGHPATHDRRSAPRGAAPERRTTPRLPNDALTDYRIASVAVLDGYAETRPTAKARAQAATKRILDIVIALLMLIALAPLLLAIAIMIKRDSPGPVFFRQRRLGKDLEYFSMLKFRTMRDTAAPGLHRRFIEQLATANAGAHPNGLKKLTQDPRVTRVGGVLRRLSLDELPQLFNVLRGDMSLVGPRPALHYELDYYRRDDFYRFAVSPGLTGLWQVSGRSLLGFHEMLELDVEYARRAKLLTDIAILARTPRAAVGRTA